MMAGASGNAHPAIEQAAPFLEALLSKANPSDSAFYTYPGTGTWYCFCSDHVGKRCGSVTSFDLLGFVPTRCEQLAWEEIASLLGRDTPQGTGILGPNHAAMGTDVRVLVKGEPSLADSPLLSLPALLDLLDALKGELRGSPGLIPLWAEELRREPVAHLEAAS